MRITIKQLPTLLRGASYLACGGGLSFIEQEKLLNAPRLLAGLTEGVALISPNQLADDALCVTVSEVGAADAPVMDKKLLPLALAKLEQQLGKKVSALIPGEIGQEMIVIEAALSLRLPIVDTDYSGARAVPRLSDNVLVAQGVPFTFSPAVVLTTTGEVKVLGQQKNILADEKAIRPLVPAGEVVTVLGGGITGAMVKKYLQHQSFGLAMKMGTAITRKGLLEFLAKPTLLQPKRVKVLTVTDVEAQGFSVKRVNLQVGKRVWELEVENEFMSLRGPEITLAFPDLIMVGNVQEKRGVHSSELKPGMELFICAAPSALSSYRKGTK